MNYFKKWNLIAGWGAFAVASLVYILTMEPTASMWDCAEFIATSYKLEVGHPPGAPLFMMIARFFTIFAPSTEYAAQMVNLMSSLCGGFTVLFLFWSITHLARRIYTRQNRELSKGQIWTIIGAGLVGSLAYCFTDTQWFSAVEAEVYSMSSMFTALVFWAILKWEEVADQPHSTRWLILIAYFMGLSIGIHILNLLTIPALVFVYYFKRYPTITKWGIVKATLVSGALLVSINYIIIPYTVRIGAFIDRVLHNGVGVPVNIGFAIFIILLFALCAWAIYYTHKKGKVLANTIVLCATAILLGYSSYASVIIRASANPPMNSNNPSNPYSLYSLLNRDQYGDRPLLYGHYFSSPPVDTKTNSTYYIDENGKYTKGTIITGYEFPDEFKFLFPRMYHYDKANDYKSWVSNFKGRDIRFGDEIITVPTAGENLQYFFSYQLNFMYWRYFLWNFVGRQSDTQSSGDLIDGNWLSGIKFIDELYLGPQDKLPSEMANNKGRNTYYFLPFILGLIGLIYQLNRDKRNFVVVMWLFLMLGIVLVLYFNTTPGEPRERDYVYAGSFYAFCIWIGLGVLSIRDMLLSITKKDSVAIAAAATVICLGVPVILAAQNWDDHDRSHRYVARDIGWNYLQSTLPNSIIMNYGDNDTFPLWYNQEVEGVRPDVKIMNMSYLGAEWYVDQMRICSNDSKPVPMSLPRSKYTYINESLPVKDLFKGKSVDTKQVIDFVISENPDSKLKYGGRAIDFIPTKKLAIPVDKQNAIASGIVKPEDAHLMVDTVYLTIPRDVIRRHELIFLDLLANFNWKRPLYFTQIYSVADFGIRDYLQFDGHAYRFVPIYTPYKSPLEVGRIDLEYTYEKLMEEFRYGNVSDKRVYADTFTQNSFNASNTRNTFARLAKELLIQGDTTMAVQVLDAGIEKMPFDQIRHTYRLSFPHIEAYYMAGEFTKGNAVLDDYARILMEYIEYLMQFKEKKADLIMGYFREKVSLLDELQRIAEAFDQHEQAGKIEEFFAKRGF